jgi:hypothetical protein
MPITDVGRYLCDKMGLTMPFEVFDKRTAAAGSPAFVSIQKQGIIRMNTPAFALLGEPEAVELLFDQERQVLGLRAVDPTVEHAYKVRAHSRSSSHLVSGAAFASHYGIDVDRARRWPAQMEGDILCIHIGETPVS